MSLGLGLGRLRRGSLLLDSLVLHIGQKLRFEPLGLGFGSSLFFLLGGLLLRRLALLLGLMRSALLRQPLGLRQLPLSLGLGLCRLCRGPLGLLNSFFFHGFCLCICLGFSLTTVVHEALQ